MIWVATAGILVVAAFFVGRALHPEESTAAAFDLTADAYQASTSISGLSKAGFSGFTEGGSDGRTVIAGRVVSVTPDSITLEGQGGQRSTMRLSGQGSPTRLESSTRDALKPGVTVIVRREPGSDLATAVLIVSTD